jgi:asparagine synthase (glutamine-hydrolysing)
VFRTRSDTEVIVHGFEEWGTRVVERLAGMFAFALFDRRAHRLFLARDRLGKKPLYLRREEGRILFGSELKAILADASVPRRVSPRALVEYLTLRYVPCPRTPLEGIEKLPPAHWLLAERGGRVTTGRYWDVSFAAPLRQDRRLWVEDVLAELDRAVRARLVSERPLGAFLSGGVDSSAIVTSMTRVSSESVQACAVGFAEQEFDERPFAREVARHAGVELFEEEVRPDPERDLELLAFHLDDLLSDSSALPTWHVSRAARARVTVALSGDGGDENFAGYRRYRFDLAENRVRSLIPAGVRGPLFASLSHLYPKADWLPRPLRFKRTLQNLALSPAEAYFRSVSATPPEEVFSILGPDVDVSGVDPFAALAAAWARADGEDPLSRVLYTDIHTNLTDDILAKVDRAAMAVGLEVRSPLLDHAFVELCARIPSSEKLWRGQGKAVFKAALRGRVPEQVLRRKKSGFSIPLRRWLNEDLSPSLDRMTAGEAAARHLSRERVATVVAEHRAGTRDHGELLWALLLFDKWHRRWIERA